MDSKKKILVFIDWFDPAFKAGGPIRSCVNFVNHFYKDFELFVFTSHEDLNTAKPLEGIIPDTWMNYQQKAKVFYASPTRRSKQSILQIIRSIDPDYIYLNSFFSFRYSIIPLWLKRSGKVRATVVLAPRGMLKRTALAFKPVKKKFFIALFRLLGIHTIIKFQATDQQEESDILHFFPGSKVNWVPNLSGAVSEQPTYLAKIPGTLKMLFVGRVHPIKNLLYLLQTLRSCKGSIDCTVIGVKEDPVYWDECLQEINKFPSSIRVNYLGEKEHQQIMKELDQHHIFVLPTQGENFGHAIFEALSKGRPVLISDQTPWRSLQAKQAGWDLPLSEPAAFSKAIEEAVEWDQERFGKWSNGAMATARGFIEKSSFKHSYLKLFS